MQYDEDVFTSAKLKRTFSTWFCGFIWLKHSVFDIAADLWMSVDTKSWNQVFLTKTGPLLNLNPTTSLDLKNQIKFTSIFKTSMTLQRII